ncbi:uncharacterized protein METZ01_LOCUS15181 [marine metagenome]|uniref:Uncharacterized protein n=1 Tax=marine metagenome TaxID=408172 RepID=A0A381P7I2_9ZZZZ
MVGNKQVTGTICAYRKGRWLINQRPFQQTRIIRHVHRSLSAIPTTGSI